MLPAMLRISIYLACVLFISLVFIFLIPKSFLSQGRVPVQWLAHQ
jgi:hypothetical protein